MLKKKRGRRQGLDEQISEVVFTRNKADTQIMTQHLLTNIMIINLVTLCVRIKHRISREFNGRDIVTPNDKDKDMRS